MFSNEINYGWLHSQNKNEVFLHSFIDAVTMAREIFMNVNFGDTK